MQPDRAIASKRSTDPLKSGIARVGFERRNRRHIAVIRATAKWRGASQERAHVTQTQLRDSTATKADRIPIADGTTDSVIPVPGNTTA
jgi:hypothetical protein